MLLQQNVPVVACMLECLFGAGGILGPDVMSHHLEHLHGREAADFGEHFTEADSSRCGVRLTSPASVVTTDGGTCTPGSSSLSTAAAAVVAMSRGWVCSLLCKALEAARLCGVHLRDSGLASLDS